MCEGDKTNEQDVIKTEERDDKCNKCGEKYSPGCTEDVACVTLQQSSVKLCQCMPGKS